MTDGLRIAHPQDCPLEGNPEVGNPEGNQWECAAVCNSQWQFSGSQGSLWQSVAVYGNLW